MGISLRELVYKFKQRTLQIFKLLLLEKRVLFFGQKVERLSAYQYSLVSLVPDLLRHLENVGSPSLGYQANQGKSEMADEDDSDVRTSKDASAAEAQRARLKRWALPLRPFGEADTGALEILNPALAPLLNLTAPDRKFMDGRPVLEKYEIPHFGKRFVKFEVDGSALAEDMSMNQEIEFEGSDDDIRARFEQYLVNLMASIQATEQALVAPADSPLRGKNLPG
ncbi:late secretory pathway protein avl9 [Rhizophlyctis rosea]|uniref:Late secretory pathway protein avl9 n=1 Tax=Rhizophlyctis rosea TaxID=64517 RepID=A0AAD5SJY6_9FUNG|nr:late secretory pathway protein avl9 [Rhizophlyctis rosea]